MDQQRVAQLVADLSNDVNILSSEVEVRVTKIEGNLDRGIKALEAILDFQISTNSAILIRYLQPLQLNVQYLVLRAYMPHSPQLFAILSSIWQAAVWVYNKVKWALDLLETFHIMDIHDMLYSLWPSYRTWVDGLFQKISELSGYIGWGGDGIGHLINAMHGGINVLGGLMGKPDSWLYMKWTEKAADSAQYIASAAKLLQQNPGKIMDLVFTLKSRPTKWETEAWWKDTEKWISEGLEKGETALQGISGVFSELLSIQTGMPQAVRNAIPFEIWSGIERADNMIHDKIMPAISIMQRSLQFMDAVMINNLKRISGIVDTLAHPGTLLLTVDELTAGSKYAELNAIDDVTSREFERWTDIERGEMADSMDEFERINRAMKAPTPTPAFLDMEVLPGMTVGAITAEPHETWFVGGYDDPR